MNNKNKKFSKELYYLCILFSLIVGLVLGMDYLSHMNKAIGDSKTYETTCYNIKFNVYGEYYFEKILISISIIINTILLFATINKLYEEGKC